jgi:cytochrome c oxidase assembly protein subunit 15
MASTLEHLRERTNGYTVTAEQYVNVAYTTLAALTLIVLTGAAVRLTGSGLGCPTWPKCYGNVYPPLNTHAVIEFANRLITFPVSVAAGAAWLLALRRRPYRRDLVWLGAMLPLGVIGQAVLGGFTVKGALDYGWVMGHFALSMLILLAAVLLVWRSREERPEQSGARVQPAPVHAIAGGSGGGGGVSEADAEREHAAPADRSLVLALRALACGGALTIFAGTAATAAGPHAGGSPGQRINRLSFDGRGTMDFVIHRHAEIALLFSICAVGVWWLARRRGAAQKVRRPLTVLCVLLALQGAVGLDQYETHLPTGLVWIHVGLACSAWLSVLWAACAAGPLPSRRPTQAVEGRLRRVAPLKFPGN